MTLKISTYAGALDRDVVPGIMMADNPHEAALFTRLVGKGRTKPCGQVKAEWQIAPRPLKRIQIDNGGAAYDAATTALTLDSTTGFFPGAVIRCETGGETLLCTAVNSATVITVIRGIGSVAAGASGVANNAWLLVVGQASGEGTNFPAARLPARTERSNTVQHFKVPVSRTGDRKRSVTVTEDEGLHQRRWALKELTSLIGSGMIHGVEDNDTVGADGNIVRTMGGVRSRITTNVQNQAGTLSFAQWKTFCSEKAFAQKPGSTKLCLMGPLLHDVVHGFYEGKLYVENMAEAVGLRILRCVTPSGDLLLVRDTNLNNADAGSCVVLDEDDLYIRHFEDKNNKSDDGMPRLVENLQLPGADVELEGFEARVTLEDGDEKNHAYLYGVTAGA